MQRWVYRSRITLGDVSEVIGQYEELEAFQAGLRLLRKMVEEGKSTEGVSDIFKPIRNGVLKRIDKLIDKDEYDANAIDRIFKTLYDFGDTNRIWLSF